MRADAAQNRELLLDAARHLFSQQGADVSMRAIAAQAGVGIATLYRHFPTREDLLVGVGEQLVGALTTLCEQATTAWDDNPQAAWQGWLEGVGGITTGAWLPRIAESDEDLVWSARVTEIRTHAMEIVDTVLTRAKDAGLCRGDVDPVNLMAGIGTITRPLPGPASEVAPDLRRWLVEVYRRGLRPDDPRPTD